MVSEDGPYLQMAVLCEKVQIDPDGSASILRVTDQVAIRGDGTNGNWSMAKQVITLSLALSFSPGTNYTRHTVLVRPSDEGSVALDRELELDFSGTNRSGNFVLPLELEITNDGLYWFDVYLDGSLVTRVPLHVRLEGLQLQA